MGNEEYFEMDSINRWSLNDVPVEKQTDEIIDAEMGKNPWAFWHIKDDNMKTLDRCLKAAKCSWVLVEYIPKKMQTDELIDIAIDNDVWAFREIKDESKKTLERCLRAVKGCKLLIDYVPEDMRDKVMNKIKKGE